MPLMQAGGHSPAHMDWLFVGGDSGGYNIPDAQTFYLLLGIGAITGDPQTSAGTAATSSLPNVLASGRIVAAYLDILILGTLGTSETGTASIRVNNTTDTTISSAVKWDATSASFNNTALSIPVSSGDFFQVKFVAPTFATNPTATFHLCRVVCVFP